MSLSFSDDDDDDDDDGVGTSHVLRLLVSFLLLSESFQCPSAWMLLASTFTLRIRVSIVEVVVAGAINGTAVGFDLVCRLVVMLCRWRIGVRCGRCDRLSRAVRVLILAQIGPLIRGIR